jgi:hypothetical protein
MPLLQVLLSRFIISFVVKMFLEERIFPTSAFKNLVPSQDPDFVVLSFLNQSICGICFIGSSGRDPRANA